MRNPRRGENLLSSGGDLMHNTCCQPTVKLPPPWETLTYLLVGRWEYSLTRWRPSQNPGPGEETPSLWTPRSAGGNTPSIGGDLRKNPGLLAKNSLWETLTYQCRGSIGRWEYSLTRWRRSQNPGLLAKRLPLWGWERSRFPYSKFLAGGSIAKRPRPLSLGRVGCRVRGCNPHWLLALIATAYHVRD